MRKARLSARLKTYVLLLLTPSKIKLLKRVGGVKWNRLFDFSSKTLWIAYTRSPRVVFYFGNPRDSPFSCLTSRQLSRYTAPRRRWWDRSHWLELSWFTAAGVRVRVSLHVLWALQPTETEPPRYCSSDSSDVIFKEKSYHYSFFGCSRFQLIFFFFFWTNNGFFLVSFWSLTLKCAGITTDSYLLASSTGHTE